MLFKVWWCVLLVNYVCYIFERYWCVCTRVNVFFFWISCASPVFFLFVRLFLFLLVWLVLFDLKKALEAFLLLQEEAAGFFVTWVEMVFAPARQASGTSSAAAILLLPAVCCQGQLLFCRRPRAGFVQIAPCHCRRRQWYSAPFWTNRSPFKATCLSESLKFFL